MHSSVAAARRRVLAAGPAVAGAGTQDVPALRAAAALEALLVLAYSAVLDLPVVRAAGDALTGTLTGFRAHHAEHATAFNRAVVGVGGTAQVEPDATYLRIVRAAEPGLRTPAAALTLLAQVEEAARTAYAADAGAARTADVRTLALSVAAVEAEHVGALRVAGALLAAGLPPVPTTLGDLPAAVGSAGLPAAPGDPVPAETPAPTAAGG